MDNEKIIKEIHENVDILKTKLENKYAERREIIKDIGKIYSLLVKICLVYKVNYYELIKEIEV